MKTDIPRPRYVSTCHGTVPGGLPTIPDRKLPDFETLGLRLRQHLATFKDYRIEDVLELPDVFSAQLNLRGEPVLCGLGWATLWDDAHIICIRGHVSPFIKWQMVVYNYRILHGGNPKAYRRMPDYAKVVEATDNVFDMIANRLPII